MTTSNLSAVTKFMKKRSVKFGLPFLLLMVGGSFGLREFTSLRYKFSKVSPLSYEESQKHGIEKKKPGEVTLESEYEKIKNLDLDNWKQIRGPRPWEEKDES
ncbi:cytochrome c oxidase assembly protein COX16 homolog, mitochondrial [Dendroctonus ponderosae]